MNRFRDVCLKKCTWYPFARKLASNCRLACGKAKPSLILACISLFAFTATANVESCPVSLSLVKPPQNLAMGQYPSTARLPDKGGVKKEAKTTSILIVTGGHRFEERAFFEMFDRMDGIQWQSAEFGNNAQTMLNQQSADAFDVIVHYDMNQKRGDWTEHWVEMLGAGKPTVFLHHALGSYADWPQYEDIVGGHANFFPQILHKIPNATYHEDLKYTVHVKDHKHPITRGLSDFEIVDEVYNHYLVSSHVHTLLTVDHPESGKVVGWTHRYGRSRIVYLLPGHGPGAYTNPTYQELVRRAILWSAGRLR